jgi:hypothetical protein
MIDASCTQNGNGYLNQRIGFVLFKCVAITMVTELQYGDEETEHKKKFRLNDVDT